MLENDLEQLKREAANIKAAVTTADEIAPQIVPVALKKASAAKLPKGLTPKQERFCKHYVSEDFFGNGLASYKKAYNTEGHGNAKVNSSKLLNQKKILDRINELLDASGFNNQHADKQLYMVLTQNADLKAKMMAIREFNKLKGRIVEKSINLNGNLSDILKQAHNTTDEYTDEQNGASNAPQDDTES